MQIHLIPPFVQPKNGIWLDQWPSSASGSEAHQNVASRAQQAMFLAVFDVVVNGIGVQ